MYYYYWSGSGIPSLMLFIDWQLCESWLVPVYTIQQSAIVNFNLPLLYIIFTKTNGTTIYFYLLILWDRSRKRVDEDIARMSGEYVTITVILDQSENFYISPWMQCITTLLLSSRIGLTVQQIDITQSMLAWQTWQDLYSLARSRLAWKRYSSKVPASVRGQIN